jgi:hypothetical protein
VAVNQLCFKAAKEIQKLRPLFEGQNNLLVEKGVFGEFVERLRAERGQHSDLT